MKTHYVMAGTGAGLAIYCAATATNWQPVRRCLPRLAVVAIQAIDADTLLVAAEHGPAQQSFDGGATWMVAPGAQIAPIGLDAATIHGPQPLANPRLRGATAYALLPTRPAMLIGAGAGGLALFRSDDDGIHWEPLGLPPDVGTVTCLVPDAAAAGAAWAGTTSGALLRSGDQGQTRREIAREPASILCLASVLAETDL